MSSTCVSCQDKLSCNDSPLSITGNLIGMATFAYAILFTIVFYLVAFTKSAEDLTRLRDNLNELHFNAVKLYSRVEKLLRDSRSVDDSDKEALKEQRKRLEKALGAEVFRTLQKRLTWRPTPLNKKVQTLTRYRKWRQRLKYVMSENKIKEKLHEINKSISALRNIEADVLQRKREDEERDLRALLAQFDGDLIQPQMLDSQLVLYARIMQELTSVRSDVAYILLKVTAEDRAKKEDNGPGNGD